MSSPREPFHKGDVWEPEVTAESEATGGEVEPGEILGEYWPPSEAEAWANDGAGAPVTFVHQSGGKWKATGGIPLTEPGLWRALVKATGGFIGVQPTLIEVFPERES